MTLKTIIFWAFAGSVAGVIVFACLSAFAGLLLHGALRVDPWQRAVVAAKDRVMSVPDGSVQAAKAEAEVENSDHAQGSIFTALDLLWLAESSRGKNFGPSDGGKAFGHFGQHGGPNEHWDIGCRALGVDWSPGNRTDLARAAAIVAANWAIYAEDALRRGDVEMLIRKHRLPNAPMRADNDAYVRRIME